MPALLDHVDLGSPIAQQETFGPVALILPAKDLDQAIAIANGVPQGLVAALYSADPKARERFAARAQAGMLKARPQHPRHRPRGALLRLESLRAWSAGAWG